MGRLFFCIISKAAGSLWVRFSPRARQKIVELVHFRTVPPDAIVQFSVMAAPFSVTRFPPS